MAERNTEMRKRKLNNFDSGQQIISNWLYEFKFDLGKSSSLSVKIFTGPDIEWGRFITLSRSHRGILHDYDIVIGPTANDYTNPTIQFYLSGGLGEVGSDAAIDELVRLLWPFKLSPQYYFATQRAISCLTLIRKGIF
jgi:hypothetical protein